MNENLLQESKPNPPPVEPPKEAPPTATPGGTGENTPSTTPNSVGETAPAPNTPADQGKVLPPHPKGSGGKGRDPKKNNAHDGFIWSG